MKAFLHKDKLAKFTMIWQQSILSSEMSQKDRIGMTQSLRFSWDSFSGFR